MKTKKQVNQASIRVRAVGLLAVLSLVSSVLPRGVLAKTSNDPYAYQWGYEDTGVYRAWDKTTGSRDVVVAIIDNGFDHFHPDLRDNVWQNEKEIPDNRIDDDKNGYIDDVYGWNFMVEDANRDGVVDRGERQGTNDPRPDLSQVSSEDKATGVVHHGTFVAGLIGATGGNQRDGVGLNWQVKLMNLKVIGANGVGDVAPLAPAIRYAVDNGAHIINISMVGSEDESVRQAALYAYARGIVLVAAAGNNYFNLNTNPSYPICIDAQQPQEVLIGVSAIGRDHRLAQFSNTGSSCIDITAPGVAINSAVGYAPEYGFAESYGRLWQGTSFAAPFVSGAAALIKSLQPSWRAPEIYEAILQTVHRTPPTDVAAYENLYGAGRLQIDKAVQYALDRAVSPAAPAEPPPIAILPVPNAEQPAAPAPAKDKRRLSAYNPATGEFAEAYLGSDKRASLERPETAGAETAAQGKNDPGEDIFVVARKKTGATYELSVYNRKWWRESRFELNLAGPVVLAVGDATGDAAPEIIVGPRGASREVFRIFSLSGQELAAVKHTAAHEGVGLTVSGQEVSAVFWDQGELRLHRYQGGALAGSFALQDLGRRAEVALANLDKDSELEYVFGSGPKVTPIVAEYERDGSFRLSFSVPGGNGSGVSVMAFDYLDDARDEIIAYPNSGPAVVGAWKANGKRAAEWSFFAGRKLDRFNVLRYNS